jgi:membrane protein implicated in regulation of membrane protease activity
MPIERLIFIIILAMALAAATIAVALAVLDTVQASPVLGLAALSIIALCASFAWRWFSDRKTQDTDQE